MSRTVRLEGLSAAVNIQDLRLHFAGLEIPQGGVTIVGGERGVAYIEFTMSVDARSALRLSGHRIKNSVVYVYPSSIAEMERAMENYKTSFSSRSGSYEDRKLERQDSSAHRTHIYLRITAGTVVSNKSAVRRFFEGLNVFDIMNTRDCHAIRRGDALVKFSNSTDAYEGKRRYRDSRGITVMWSSEREWLHCSTLRKERSHPRYQEGLLNEQDSIYNGNFHVLVENLKCATTREELKKLFNLESKDHISFLVAEKGQEEKACFVMFNKRKEYNRVLQLNNVPYNGSPLFISPISKAEIKKYLTGKITLLSNYHKRGKCIFLRNFPSPVAKSDIQEFFAGFSLDEKDISLLCDKDGVGLGEAIVTFSSEEDAEKAQKLHRKKFHEKEIPLRRIPEEKLQDFLSTISVHLMTDPYDCVTQEDDLLDGDSAQEDDTRDDEMDDNIPDEDSGFHQTDNTHACVTQEDDEPDNSAIHVDDAPSTSCMLNENIHVDNGNAVPIRATSSNDGSEQ